MNIERVWGKSFRSYESFDLPLPEGVTAIIGPNGAGKSSLVTAIEVALFGERSLSRYVSRVSSDLDMEVGVEFTQADRRYRVRRGYSAKGAGKSYLLAEQFLHDVGDWEPRTKETAAETQKWLERLIGVSRETFRASVFLGQGDGAAFTEAQPRDRKQILADVLGLDVWAWLEVEAKAQRIPLREQVAMTQAKIAELERVAGGRDEAVAALEQARGAQADVALLVAVREQERDDAAAAGASADAKRQALASAEREVAQREREIAAWEQQIEDHREQRDALNSEIEADAESGRLYERLEEFREARDRIREAARQQALAQMLDNERAGCERGLSECEGILVGLNAQRTGLLTGKVDTCAACGQALNEAARQKRLEQVRAEIDVEQASIREFRQRLAEIKSEMPKTPEGGWPTEDELAAAEALVERAGQGNVRGAMAQMKAARVVDLERDCEKLHERIRQAKPELDGAREHLTRAREAVADVPSTNALPTAIAALEAVRREAENVARVVAIREQAVQTADDAAWRLDSERVAAEEGLIELATLQRIEKAAGRDGIPAMIVETIAVPQIETEANRILAELGAEMTVELRTQRATQKGDIREALDIVVTDPSGEAVYEDFSGGERTRLNLALRIALSRLLAARRGAQVRLLVLDEPEFLDDAGMDRLAGILRTLTEFDRVLIVSHHEILRQAFDAVLTVTKTNGVSSIPYVAEQVTA